MHAFDAKPVAQKGCNPIFEMQVKNKYTAKDLNADYDRNKNGSVYIRGISSTFGSREHIEYYDNQNCHAVFNYECVTMFKAQLDQDVGQIRLFDIRPPKYFGHAFGSERPVPIYNDILIQASDLLNGDLRKEMTLAERDVYQRVQQRTDRFDPKGGIFGGGGWDNITLGRFNVISGHETVVTLLPPSGKSNASRAVTFDAEKNELSVNPARIDSDAFKKALIGAAPEKAFWLLVNIMGGEDEIANLREQIKPLKHLASADQSLQKAFAASARGLSRDLDASLAKIGLTDIFTRDELSSLMQKIAGRAYLKPSGRDTGPAPIAA